MMHFCENRSTIMVISFFLFWRPGCSAARNSPACKDKNLRCLRKCRFAYIDTSPALSARRHLTAACFIQRALHTGLLACIWAVKLIRHGALPDISEPPPVPIGRLFSAPNSKPPAGNYGCNRRSHLGAWQAPGRRLKRDARLCVAVAQVVKVQAGCVTNSSSQSCSATASCPCCRHNNQISVVIEPGAEVGWPVLRTSMLR